MPSGLVVAAKLALAAAACLPNPEAGIRPCELVFINMENAVETWFRIAFASDNEEPAKGLQGRDWRCLVMPSGMR
jgi:hypothetical protein